MGPRERRRRLRFGLSTLLGFGRRGFFIPYRYAGGVTPAGTRPRYTAVSAVLRRCEGDFGAVLHAIESFGADLFGIGAKTSEAEAPVPAPRFDQAWFPPLDAAAAYALIRERKPARIVEIGSGHSTRFLARAVHDGGLATTITAWDPAPRSAIDGLCVAGKPVEWIRATVQEAGDGIANELSAGDVLFIDTSHILMPGSDVDILFNHVLPVLPAGVLVHIHDIFLPDDYPAEWDWRGYNEQLALIPMLLGGGWTPLFASHYVETRMTAPLAATLVARLPNPEAAPNTSLWLLKA
ncbi:MAG TPA: class I SAM-dependent methyltransferase [Alphaproteobacteria bacterium]|nr:class I SAM-dependent methyltransferase [Alphaproteobacteria bacterium]